MKITVNAPSFKRPDGVQTLKYLPFCRVWVCETEAEDYRRMNPGATIIPVPYGVQGNLCRVRNHILNEEQAAGINAICLVDDDLHYFSYWENWRRIKMDGKEFFPFLQHYTDLAVQFGVKLWGVNVTNDKQAYMEYSPFSLLSYIGGPFSVHLNSPLRYDENLPLKEDYDMTLQHLNVFRRVLRINKYYYMANQGGSGSGQRGGCSLYRSVEEEKRQLLALQKKWGPKIVKVDKTDRHHWTKRKKKFDVNPIIRVPINGI